MQHLRLILKQIRVHQWVKNVLVFAPLFFVGQFFMLDKLSMAGELFMAFSLLASSMYILNDINDRHVDRLHPKKKNRPIAAGKIKLWEGYLIMAIFLAITGFLMTQFNLKTNILLGGYLVLNLLYSNGLKSVAIIDIFLVALMYLIRIKAGGELFDIEVSEWLVLVTFFLALFLIIGKRRAELTSKSGHSTREVLKSYNEQFLDYCLVVVISATVIGYSLYTVSMEISYLLYSSFFVFFGMFRYVYLIYVEGKGEAPDKLIFKDMWLLITVVLWAAYVFGVFYYFG
ncbi:UbiA prenyltransferase family protein [Candidatus Peregrinibacteria bacterium]|jgi:decaprenyl-phosphate phosphoribosyltransferase|nr:UbiA prenyltransferase family protein [Candidatus Peregrinibacteria bacterium]